jgi:hypothetical protein
MTLGTKEKIQSAAAKIGEEKILKNDAMVLQLTKVEHRNLPSGMFQIPAGYTEDKSGM